VPLSGKPGFFDIKSENSLYLFILSEIAHSAQANEEITPEKRKKVNEFMEPILEKTPEKLRAHAYLRTHAIVSTSTSRCRHPMSTSRNACACKMSGLQRSWMSGRSVRRSLFSRSRIAEFTVQSSVSSQIS
jgi:hypothetical protein